MPTEVTDPATGKRVAFEDAPETLLVTDPDCWVLHPGEAWHGFDGLEDGYCMLDPIKVTVVAPGIADGWLVRAARHPGARSSRPISCVTASSTRRRRTSRSCFCFRSA